MAEEFWVAGMVDCAARVALSERVAPRTVAFVKAAGDTAEIQHRGSDPNSNHWRSSRGGCGACILRSCDRERRSLGRKISCRRVCCGR